MNRRTQAASSVLLLSLGLSASAQVTLRVSVDPQGHQSNRDSITQAISANGRFVAFESAASNLVAGDTNGARDAFVRDRLLETTERVNVSSAGAQSNGSDFFNILLAISADGRCVTFRTNASNLVPGDTNGVEDIFVRDRQLGTTTRVSVDSAGNQANAQSEESSISADGRYIVFRSYASNLAPGDTNGRSDIFVRDQVNGTTELVSVNSGGVQSDNNSQDGVISANGRFVAFASYGINLVPGDTNGLPDVFLRDRFLATTERVSLGAGGAQPNGSSFPASISADGRSVAFESEASNLAPGDNNGLSDVFIRDRRSGTTELVSLSTGGGSGNQGVTPYAGPAMSPDARCVVFVSSSTDLVAGDTNGDADVFLRDRLLGTTERVSVATDGGQGNQNSEHPSVSADGRFVGFSGSSSNLIENDTNQFSDVFLRDRAATGFTAECLPGSGGVGACPCSNPPGTSGSGCDNSAATGGAILSAAGVAYLSMDGLALQTSGELPNAVSVVYQGTAPAGSTVYGQGVRCVGGSLVRLYAKNAQAGSILVPDVSAGEAPISARSAAKGVALQPGVGYHYFVAYRDAIVLGGCPAASTFNTTQAGQVVWWP